MNTKISKKFRGLLISILAFLVYIILMYILYLHFEFKYIFLFNMFIAPFSSSLFTFFYRLLRLDDYYANDVNEKTLILGSYLCDILIGVLWGAGLVLVKGLFNHNYLIK